LSSSGGPHLSERWAAGAWAGPTRVEILKMTAACCPGESSKWKIKKNATHVLRGVFSKKRVLRGVLELETSGFKLKIKIKKRYRDGPRAVELKTSGF